MSGPVYEVRVTLKERPALVPMTVVKLLGENWAVGYVMPSGHHKKYNCKGNEYPVHTEAEAIERLERIAKERRWRRWWARRELNCIYLDEEAER